MEDRTISPAESDAAHLPALSVVVPTYHRPEQVLRLLDDLAREPGVTEVVLVVDGPDPDLEAAVLRRADERLRLVVLPENAGQAAAREAGVRAASGEVVLLLDDDVRLEPGTALGHARVHAGADDVVVVGHNPVALPAQRRPGMAATYLYAQEYERAWSDLLRQPESVLDRLWAGQVSVRRRAYLEASGPGWPAKYHEDQDLGRRLRSVGQRGAVHPELRSRHHHVRTVQQSVEEARRQGEALALLSRRWPEVHTPDYATRPGPLGVLRLVSGPVVGRRVVAIAQALAAVAGTARLWGVETAALRVARQTALRGALRQARELG